MRPVGHLLEVVNGVLKWRIRFDALPFEEQQSLIADAKSRFCAGDKFEKQRFDFYIRPPILLKYGGAKESLVSQAEHLSAHRSGCGDENKWVLPSRSISRGFWLTKWRPPTAGLLRIRRLCLFQTGHREDPRVSGPLGKCPPDIAS